MSVGFQKQSMGNADRVIRMQKLISSELCRSAVQGSDWSVLDRFLYRGMRALLFHRDLEMLRAAAKKALLRDLNADGELHQSPFTYLRAELLVWTLRFKSIAFVLGSEVKANSSLEMLFHRLSA